MMLSRILLLLVALLASGPLLAQKAVQKEETEPMVPAQSDRGRDLLARVRPAVVQIKGYFGGNTAQAFHGTGFAVAANGVIVTNYHVVAQKVLYPEKYRLEYHTPEGKTGALTVLGIDVRNDLSVVRADDFTPPPLAINRVTPAKGSRAYSIGFPLDVGLTITEGISNGRVTDSFGARIHYSGALNGGMSGGPALNAEGQVIGVNVAGYRFQQLVSFLVPAEHLQSLIERSLKQPATATEMKADVTTQLRAHSAGLLAGFSQALPTQVTARYALPAKAAPYIDCNAGGDPGTESPVNTVTINCSAKAGLYVQEGLSTGDITYSHHVLTTDKLDAWRFAKRLSGFAQASGMFGRPRHVAPFACESSVVKLRGFDAALMVCTRAYRKLEGLYDFTVRVTSLNESKRGFASHLDMHGIEFAPGMQFVRRYVESMEWKP